MIKVFICQTAKVIDYLMQRSRAEAVISCYVRLCRQMLQIVLFMNNFFQQHDYRQ